MQNWKRVLAMCLCIGMLFGLSGCKRGAEPNYSSMIDAPLDVSITECLSAETLQVMFGKTFKQTGVCENGTQVTYTSVDEDGMHVVLNMQNSTLSGYHVILTSLENVVLVENLGEVSHWCKDTHSLLTYFNGYMMEIIVIVGGDKNTQTYAIEIMRMVMRSIGGV